MAEETKSTGSQDKNVGMAMICYLGILVIIPLLINTKNDPFVKFHIKQGLVLLVSIVIVNITWIIPILGWIAGVIGNIILLVLAIIGIINSASGKEEKLPLIGQYAKNFKI